MATVWYDFVLPRTMPTISPGPQRFACIGRRGRAGGLLAVGKWRDSNADAPSCSLGEFTVGWKKSALSRWRIEL